MCTFFDCGEGLCLFLCLFTKLLNRTECIFFLTSLFKREPGLFCLLGYFQRKKNVSIFRYINKWEKKCQHIFSNWIQRWFLLSKLQVSCIISFRTVSLGCEMRRTWSLPELTTPTPSQNDYGSMCWSAAACRHTVLPFPPLTQKAS